ncbi:MAG: hypothetical protein ACUVYA_07170 [Planctomycetota bacterium]
MIRNPSGHAAGRAAALAIPLFFLAADSARAPGRLAASDRALVPLELPGEDALGRILSALERIGSGDLREGVRGLQECVAEGFRARYRRVVSPSDSPLVQVPAELPRDPAALRAALEEASRAETPAPDRVSALAGRLRQRVFIDPRGDIVIQDLGTPAREEPPAPGRRFLSPPAIAEFALLSLPPPALEVYRELYDPDALRVRERYLATGDRAALERLAREFFLATPGPEAGELLGDVLFEEGDAAGAVSWWRKVAEHPASEGLRDRVRAKALAGSRLLGWAKAPDAEEGPAPAATSRWGGEIAPAALPAIPGRQLELSWDSWIWSARGLGPRRAEVLTPAIRRSPLAYGSSSAHFPFVLAIDREFAYVSSVFSAYKIDARPGRGNVVREYRKPCPRELAGYEEQSDGALYTATIWKKEWEPGCDRGAVPDEVLISHYVFDVVRPVSYRSFDLTVQIPIRGLVAFDAESGAVLWTAGPGGGAAGAGRAGAGAEPPPDEGPRDVEDPFGHERPWAAGGRAVLSERADPLGSTETAAVKDFSYTSPAIVKRGLVVAAGWAQRGYVTVALRAHDLETGALVWETPIVNSGGVERTLFGEMAREPFAAAVAERDGIVYCLSQLGAIAAAELDTGRVVWASTYDTIPVQPTYGPRAIPRDVVWGPNPILLLGPACIVTPRDSDALYAFDAGLGPRGIATAGRLLWKFRVAGDYEETSKFREAAKPRDLLGYRRGQLYLGGFAEISALDLSSMDEEGFLWKDGCRLDSPARKTLAPRTTVRMDAPAALAREGVVFADRDGLRLLEFDTERVVDLAGGPARSPEWNAYRGRVQVSPSAILLTSRQLLSAFARAEGTAGLRRSF